jgi:hypothetical protein
MHWLCKSMNNIFKCIFRYAFRTTSYNAVQSPQKQPGRSRLHTPVAHYWFVTFYVRLCYIMIYCNSDQQSTTFIKSPFYMNSTCFGYLHRIITFLCVKIHWWRQSLLFLQIRRSFFVEWRHGRIKGSGIDTSYQGVCICLLAKGEGKVHPRTGHEGPYGGVEV